MAFFKCKMCGGTIEFGDGAKVGVCDSCGTMQPLPRLVDDRRANLYDRADHYRRNNEFDKAAELYEEILNDDCTDPEVYWLLVLCTYGVEYVEDPASYRRVPTVHRASFTSILDDENYLAAIRYADPSQRPIYEEDARAINEIQKGILAISQNEEPFDVFICYKETDSNGNRTVDSALATELYYALQRENFKVFFARITLEDKLGTQYEPYIFAALNSAKVMVVLGTKPEHFNAVWVKNEWKRFLDLVKKSGGKKVLIPAYRDMDPYDLPKEFSHLQAQDMNKLAFMFDLVRGIKKIVDAVEPKAAVRQTAAASTVIPVTTPKLENMVRRVYNEIRAGEFGEAKEVLNDVLNTDPDNAEALLAQMMIKERILDKSDIPALGKDLMNNYSFKLAYEKAQGKFKDELKNLKNASDITRARKIAIDAENKEDIREISESYDKAIRILEELGSFENAKQKKEEIIEKKHRRLYDKADELYMQASRHMDSQNAPEWFKTSATVFGQLAQTNYRDAAIRYDGALKMSEACEKDNQYKHADQLSRKRDILSQNSAAEEFTKLGYWRDSNERAAQCRAVAETIRNEIQIKQEINECEKEIQAVTERRDALLTEISNAEAITKKKRTNNVLRIVTIIAIVLSIVVVIVIRNQEYTYESESSVRSVSNASAFLIILFAIIIPVGFTEIKRSGGSIALGVLFFPYLLIFAIKGFFKLLIPLKDWERTTVKRAADAQEQVYGCDARLKALSQKYKQLTGTR